MSYKARQVYVVMREVYDSETGDNESTLPVAVFYDLETAEGNAEGYNLTMEEKGIEGIKFYVAVTAAYE